MPTGGGSVYQPTTVSYEPTRTNASNGSPLLLGSGNSMGTNSPLRVFRKSRPQVALLLFALISLAAGIAMLASGTTDWFEADEFETEHNNENTITSADLPLGVVLGGTTDWFEADEFETEHNNENIITSADLPLGVVLGGVFMICLGIAAMVLYLKFADWRRNCVCPCSFFDKKQLQSQNGTNRGNDVMALNPSTDPLVSHTQYATVSELPSLRPEDEERRNLMPDNKDCLSSAEESDRMLEPDRRIVLRPMGHIEDA